MSCSFNLRAKGFIVVCVYFKVSESKIFFSRVSLSDVPLHQNREFYEENTNIYIRFSSLTTASKTCGASILK